MHFRGLLLLAGMYTIAWSAFFKWYGPTLLNWLSMNEVVVADLHSSYFGTFGLLVGLVIFVSAFYPVSWIKLILAGIIMKFGLALWFSIEFLPEIGWNKRSAFHLFFNELIWFIPLLLIHLRASRVKNYLQKNEIEI
jgi:hypothetical protein